MIEIEGLKKRFGQSIALDEVSMHVRDGAMYGFVGPNGAGKTTTIRCMMGLLAADGGKLLINGIDMEKEPKKALSQIGEMPDDFGVHGNLKVLEYMEFFASCYGITGLSARKRSMTLLDQVGLEGKSDFYVDSLSKGMKQRLCLARALVHNPSILIMDEPTAGLDPRTRVEFKEILKDLKDQKKTVFISSHILSELSEVCTDIGIIDEGKVVLEAPIDDILNQINVSRQLVISVSGDQTTALKILRSHPCVETITIRQEDMVVGFTGNRQDEIMLLQQLVDAEVMVYGFARERGSLESVFMQITGHEEERMVLIHEDESGI